MRKVGCPNCEYETVLIGEDQQVCPHGCSVADYRGNYNTSHTPSAREKSSPDGLGELFGGPPEDHRLILLPVGSEEMKLVEAEKGETDA